MKLKHNAVILFLICTILLSGSMAMAANGTVKATFKFKNSSGVEQPLAYAYLYLRKAADLPPLEQFFKSADYIFGPSDGSGRITANVPEGKYFVRITRREPLGGTTRPLGPPEPGDYTWTDYTTLTVTGGSVIDLGTKYAGFFGNPITITGVIRDQATGAPLAGRYVRAQTERCIEADYSSQDSAQWVDSNRCGPVKYPAKQRTDAQGKYTLLLREPGTYYIVESRTLGDHHQQYSGNRGSTGWAVGPITVVAGDNKTINMDITAAY